MLCRSYFRKAILRTASVCKTKPQFVHFGVSKKGLKIIPTATACIDQIAMDSYSKTDTDASANRGLMTITSLEKKDGGCYASGGWKSEDGRVNCGFSSFRGKRETMEDFFDDKTCKIDGQTVCLFGIFHGETYQQTDSDFLESEKDNFRDDGSTASTAVLVGNRLYVANVGDSRTIISKAGKGTWRVGGVLAMSRAFGNRMLKQFVVAEPDIQEQELCEEFELLVLVSDGLWDVVPNDDAVSLAQSEEEPEEAAKKLIETAFSCGSADNITCIVVKLYHDSTTKPKPDALPATETKTRCKSGNAE
ncbi:hypothetical protein R6Q57_001889 [Mikania cordata]